MSRKERKHLARKDRARKLRDQEETRNRSTSPEFCGNENCLVAKNGGCRMTGMCEEFVPLAATQILGEKGEEHHGKDAIM